MPHQLTNSGEPGQSFIRIANMIRFKNRGFFTPNLFFMAFRLKYGVLKPFSDKCPPNIASAPLNAPDSAYSSGAPSPVTSTKPEQMHKVMLEMPCGYQVAISQ